MVNERHFVLVHGASHGAWCWYKLVTLLKSAGHKVTALDMASSGINPKQVLETDSIVKYSEPLIETLRKLPQEERVILVAHSFGGICISMAMELFPKKIAVAVFVASRALIPVEGSNSESKSILDDSINNILRGSFILDPEFIASHMYQLSPPEDFSLAMSLLRPINTFDDKELFNEQTRVTEGNFGTVAKVFVVGKQDQMITQTPEKDATVIPDADHMVMFSKPQELFAYFQQVAETYY